MMHKDRFQGVISFEDYLYINMLKDSSKFLTKARNINTEIKTFFMTSWPLSGFMMRVHAFFLGFLIIQSKQLFLRITLQRQSIS